MRIVFFGSGNFAVPSLLAIRTAGHELAGVFTQPARPAGRGGSLRPTPVAQVCERHGLTACEVADINADGAVAAIRDLSPEVICVADFGQMIRGTVRGLACVSCFNLHGSLLPALRGAAPVNWALIRGLKRTGVTTFEITAGLDTGPMYAQAATDIRPEETAQELSARLAEIGAELVVQTIGMLQAGWKKSKDQDASKVTLAPRLTKADGRLDFSQSAENVRNLIHGTWPWPSGQATFVRQGGKQIAVEIARAAVETAAAGGEPGTLDRELLVATGRDRLRILEIQPAGKRLMQWKDFVNGYRCSPGDRFVRPAP